MNKDTTGMVLFPLGYVNNDDYKESYFIARNVRDELVKMHIMPNEKSVQRASQSTSHSIPLVSEFSKTSKKARNPCKASQKNSKHNPVGIILCEQVQKMQDSQHAGVTYPTFFCKWASNLRPDEEEPTPGVGVGFLDIAFLYTNDQTKFQAQKKLEQEFLEIENSPAISPLDRDRLLAQASEKLFNFYDKSYSAVIIKYKEINENIAVSSEEHFRQLLESAVSKYAMNGRYGIALLRVRNGDTVIVSECTRYTMNYNYTEHRVMTPDENWESFKSYDMKNIMAYINNPQYSVDIIPCQRIYFGPQGITKYNKELMPVSFNGVINPPSKLMKQFVDKNFHRNATKNLVKNEAFLASHIGVRVARIEDGQSSGNEIASTIHSFSRVISPAIAIRADLSSFKVMRD
jgi:hypothetical protein